MESMRHSTFISGPSSTLDSSKDRRKNQTPTRSPATIMRKAKVSVTPSSSPQSGPKPILRKSGPSLQLVPAYPRIASGCVEVGIEEAPKVSFEDQIQVLHIPHHVSLSKKARANLWYNQRKEWGPMIERNTLEFEYDNEDWKNCLEEKDWIEKDGKLYHPRTHATLKEKRQSWRGLLRRLFGLLRKKKSKKAIINEDPIDSVEEPSDSCTGTESNSSAAKEEVPIVPQDPYEWAYNVWKRKGLMVGTPSDGTQRGERRRKQE